LLTSSYSIPRVQSSSNVGSCPDLSHQSFAFALYQIAADPEKYLEPLRQEAHEALSKYGWTGAAVEKMYKADSLLKESLRFHGLTNCESSEDR